MKIWTIYTVIFLYVTATTQLSQMYKLPVFISHFLDHDKGGAFIDEMKVFIIHHYGGHEMDDDWETDQKLPFMKVEIAHIDLAEVPKIILVTPFVTKKKIGTTLVYFNDSNIYSHYLNSIWQPPKQA